ncbi:phospho-N-acetylmuramoyl-pentapeptide-transferase homolog isoform X2 [Hevea brasiliensis]|uniref:phospho-N-acetylmuramoyl-pentapeptide- transferase homolog isoform X2 n=1 Tax=Hevea brasiliensis TaxID=3981 RepID=UPI0025FE9ADB|nr:phospho-N-acetylmuramoyl-pentapeptide-transferase homolog isoform X2 [Hevea brasiliensis]
MWSLYHHQHLPFSGLFRYRKPFSPFSANLFHGFKLNISNVRKRRGYRLRNRIFQVRALDEDTFNISLLDDWGIDEGTAGTLISSSDGEDSDGDFILNPVSDIDLPSGNVSTNDALTVTATRFAMIAKGRRKHRIRLGILNNLGLIVFLLALLLFVDWCAWKIVRQPLAPFYLSRPFFISTALVSIVGYLFVPFLNALKVHQNVRNEAPVRHHKKRGTPTMGGLFFIPIGIGVAKLIAGFSSVEVSGAAVATVAFASIGLLDDILSLIKNHNNGLSSQIKLFLELAAGTLFAFWLDTTSISSPYSMKMLIPLPAPLGLVCLGKCYLLLTSFCFVSMGTGVDLTDGLDGLAGGTAALAFVAMSIAVLPICSELAIFGASMAGACVGFLLHNRYRASIFMGDIGSLALGGGLAAMAACTGMFFPLFISSGFFFLETSSVIMQEPASFYVGVLLVRAFQV